MKNNGYLAVVSTANEGNRDIYETPILISPEGASFRDYSSHILLEDISREIRDFDMNDGSFEVAWRDLYFNPDSGWEPICDIDHDSIFPRNVWNGLTYNELESPSDILARLSNGFSKKIKFPIKRDFLGFYNYRDSNHFG